MKIDLNKPIALRINHLGALYSAKVKWQNAKQFGLILSNGDAFVASRSGKSVWQNAWKQGGYTVQNIQETV